jgi:serine/threonine protein kinase
VNDRRRSEREIFDALSECDADERRRLLDAECAGDAALRARIEALLEALDTTERTRGFLDEVAMADLAEDGDGEEDVNGPLPRMLGPFRLLRVMGEGGMGVVFEAEQASPKRRVAVKMLRGDMASREMARRFRREIDTLGRLRHRGIAQIYEAGNAIDGERSGVTVSYIAMELVEGAALDEHVRRQKLAPREIAAILVEVCEAVQHAHERGVVHRDLKPANILVATEEGRPQPKVLDFGVARLLPETGRALTMATSPGLIIGTMAYMSPEQLVGEADAVGARSDVYAIGVILFEMLTGRPPLDLRDRPIADAARIVRDEEPTRIGSIDERLRGDLETIVAMAIEKSPERRYPSAAALADELRRYLRDEPILARPPTRVERVARFVRRNRPLVAGTFGAFVFLLVGIITTSSLALSAMRARDAADWTAYRATIAAASAALLNHDAEAARRHLEAADDRFRSWEWQLLAAQIDLSTGRVSVPRRADVTAFGPRVPRWGAVWPTVSALDHDLPANWPAGCRVKPLAERAPQDEGVEARWWIADGEHALEAWVIDGSQRTRGSTGQRGPLVVVRRRDGSGTSVADETIEVAVPVGSRIASLAFNLERDAIAAIAIGPSGQRFAWFVRLGGGEQRTLVVENARRGELPLAVGSGANVALGGGPQSTPVLWNAESGAMIELIGHQGDMRALAFSPDGKRLASGGHDRTIRLFDLGGAQIEMERRHEDSVMALRFAPDGERLLSTSVDGTLRLWSVPTARAGMSLVATLVGHRATVEWAEFSPDGAWIVSLGDDHTLRLWPSSPAALVGEFAVPDNSSGVVEFSSDGRRLVAENSWARIRMWDVGAAAPRASVVSDPHLPAEAAMFDLALRPDGECVVGIAQDRTITMIESIGREPRAVAVAISQAVGVGFSEDGRAMALIAGDGPAGKRLRWLSSGEPVAAPLPRMVSPSIASSRDGTLVRVRDAPEINRTGGGSSQAHSVRVLDATTGDELHHVPTDVGDAAAFGALPNGRTVLATADGTDNPDESGRTIVIRDARSGEVLQQVRGHAGKVFAIAFTPDGRRMLSAGRDRLIRVWDTGTWDEVVSLVGPNAYVWALRFSPDGLRLAISSGDRTYRVWTTRSALP